MKGQEKMARQRREKEAEAKRSKQTTAPMHEDRPESRKIHTNMPLVPQTTRQNREERRGQRKKYK